MPVFLRVTPLWMVILIGVAIALHGTLILWLRAKPTTPLLCLLWLYGLSYGATGWKAGLLLNRYVGKSVTAIFDAEQIMQMPDLLGWAVRYLPAPGGMALMYALLLAILFRTWSAPLIVILCAPIFALVESYASIHGDVSQYQLDRAAGLAFHLLAMIALLLWAAPATPRRLREFRARRLGADPRLCCRKCGYDLRGVRAQTCPECGREIAAKTRARLRKSQV